MVAADDAATIRDELRPPVDVMGTSTGGSIALHLAADHPDVVRRLVIHSSAHTLDADARRLQLRCADLAARGNWRGAYSELFATVLPRGRPGRLMASAAGALLALRAPADPAGLVAEVEAEDAHAFRDRLHEIRVPTLVTGGTADRFYSTTLFRETAEGIPDGRLALYEGMGHPASGDRFEQDVLAFLLAEEDDPAAATVSA
jgi:pimeloyl-ACP methyl ester carboxylesterase